MSVSGAAQQSRIEFTKPSMRWLWEGFGFQNSAASMTPMMSEEFRDQRVLKSFREISPTFSRLFAGYANWTHEAMDRFADYYDATFRRAGTTLYLTPGRMPWRHVLNIWSRGASASRFATTRRRTSSLSAR